MAPANGQNAARHGGYAVNLAVLDGLLGSEAAVDDLLRRVGTGRTELAGRRFVPALQYYEIWRR